MTWPWSRPETRSAASNSYSGLVIAGLIAEATGGTTAAVSSATGSVQAAAGLWARCLSACRSDVPGVDAPLLAAIGFDLGTKGESLWVLDVDPITAQLRMLRAGDWTVYGSDPNPATWSYLATIPAPSGSVTRRVQPGGAAHFTYLPDSRRPWRGDAPWQRVPTLASLAAEVEAALRDEARQPVQALIPAPQGMNKDTKADLRARVLDRRQIATFMETMAAGFGTGRAAAPQADYSIKRFQPDPKPGLVSLCKEIPAAVGTVYGVPPVLMNGAGSETQTREAYRRFVATAIGPLARLVEGVLTSALEQPVTLDLGALRSWDVAGQARAYHVLREGGMSDADAMDHAGLSA